jgi:hypothetical protein
MFDRAKVTQWGESAPTMMSGTLHQTCSHSFPWSDQLADLDVILVVHDTSERDDRKGHRLTPT